MMRMLLRNLSLNLIITLLFTTTVNAQAHLAFEKDEPPTMEELTSVKERFLYNVRYGFLNLGEVEVFTTPDTTYEGMEVIHLRTVMRANHRIPFVGRRNIHYQSFSRFTDKWPYSFIFWRDDMHDEEYERYKIEFDREQGQVFFFELGEPQDTLALEDPASGGDVIFLFARMFAGTEKSYELPVYIENEKGEVTATNSTAVERRSYDAFPRPVDTYYSEGIANVDGPFGFTGEFKAWFAADDRRIPLEAHVRIIFGNVKVQLKEYERYEPN
ncbi:MAG: DUF3108 domain-containing protein [Balneolaceae bacterium]